MQSPSLEYFRQWPGGSRWMSLYTVLDASELQSCNRKSPMNCGSSVEETPGARRKTSSVLPKRNQPPEFAKKNGRRPIKSRTHKSWRAAPSQSANDKSPSSLANPASRHRRQARRISSSSVTFNATDSVVCSSSRRRPSRLSRRTSPSSHTCPSNEQGCSEDCGAGPVRRTVKQKPAPACDQIWVASGPRNL